MSNRIMMTGYFVSLLLALSGSHDQMAWGQEPTTSSSDAPAQVRWTTSKLAGLPAPPPPYATKPAFSQLKFNRPVVVTHYPAGDRMIVAEQGGKVFSFANRADVKQPELVVDLKKARPELKNLYGLTFHPKFADNHQVFVCYTVSNNAADGTRVSRFVVEDGDTPELIPDSEQIVITWLAGGHNGGCLKFGHDGMLYISTGDGAGPTPPDSKRAGQDVGNLLSAILRIDVDHPAAEAPDAKAYRIPRDNPFVDTPGARPEIYSFGYRNPWKMSFDSKTGDLWVGDVGWQLWEMIFRVEKGGNYGWSVMEGPQPVHPEDKVGPTPILRPTIAHPHTEAASITGGFVYRGKQLESLIGAYIYGDFQSGIVWAAKHEGTKQLWHKRLAETSLQLVGFGEDAAGELYLLDYRGQVYRLVPNPEPDTSGRFPRKLSDTGLFTSVARQTPAAGVVGYSINAPAWADGATAQRWLAVPPGDPITIDGRGNWKLPEGSVIAKTIRRGATAGAAAKNKSAVDDGVGSGTRLETQLLHRFRNSWRAYSYVWNEEQTDAQLAPAAGIMRPGSGSGMPAYHVAGRQQCKLCHNSWVEARTTIFGDQSASLLAISVAQLHRTHDDGSGPVDQLTAFQSLGWLAKPPANLKQAKRFVDPYDKTADLNARARSYLHVNCSHCHLEHAGGTATILLTHDLPLTKMKTVNVRPAQGTFGITRAKIVAPHDPLGSVLLYRTAKTGGGRMPRLGSSVVDERGVDLLRNWIAEMKPSDASASDHEEDLRIKEALTGLSGEDASANRRAAAITTLLNSTRGSLALMFAVRHNELTAAIREQVVAAATKHPNSVVRDLFESFVPVEQRVKRLGTVVDRAAILKLEANAERGETLFFSDGEASCKNCHRVRGKGETLGPDLSEIGKKYKPADLLEHLLEPSKFMEPKFVPYLVETAAGKVLSGLLVSRSDKEVVIRDAQNKLRRIKAADVELLVRQQKSLMPDLLLRDMTPQQVADLLAFLSGAR